MLGPKPQNARTSGMLLMTSTISPSTAAALSANSSCSGLPAAARRNIAITMMPAIEDQARRHRQADGSNQRDRRNRRDAGGITFQTNMFSTVNTAFDVAVMRLVSMPGSRSEK